LTLPLVTLFAILFAATRLFPSDNLAAELGVGVPGVASVREACLVGAGC
jgi:hypothetical protein